MMKYGSPEVQYMLSEVPHELASYETARVVSIE